MRGLSLDTSHASTPVVGPSSEKQALLAGLAGQPLSWSVVEGEGTGINSLGQVVPITYHMQVPNYPSHQPKHVDS